MASDTRSRFTAFLNPKANAENRLPNVTGQFALPGGKVHKFSAWASMSAKGMLYVKGTHTPQDLAEALKAQIDNTPVQPGPADIELKPGEIILFQNLAKQGGAEGETEEDKQKRLKRPDWYGYACTNEGWRQLAGWAQDAQGRPGFIAGTAGSFRANNSAEVDANGSMPKRRVRKSETTKPAPEV
jgi:hypothetical protein